MSHAMKLLAGITLAFSTSASADPDVTHTLRYDDAGREIEVKVGETIAFVLPANLGTGVYWTPRPNPNYEITQPPRVGNDPENRVRDATNMRVKFIRQGKTTIKIAAVPMGCGGGNAADVLRYKFVVSEYKQPRSGDF